MMKSYRQSRGQILLITLLVLTVATTVALSLIGRATLDLSMSNQLEESTRAFSAAEAGIEEALRSGVGTGGPRTLTSGVTYDVTVNSIGGVSGEVYQIAHQTPKDVTETVWLVNHTDEGDLIETPFYINNTIELCWSQGSTAPALIVSVLYKDASINPYKVSRVALDPNAASRANNFDSSGITVNGCGLGYYGKIIDFTALGISPAADTLLALRIRPAYADTTIAVNGGALGIPKQGNVIESTGMTGTGISRKVIVYQQYRAPLTIFDSVIYSQSSFSH